MKQLKIPTRIAFTLLAFWLGMTCAMAQTTYARGTLYHIVPASQSTKTLDYNPENGVVGVEVVNDNRAEQHWTVTELAGSWRIINPFSNLAVRAVNTELGIGENNGTDEAQ